MYCTACGNVIHDEAAFCTRCGVETDNNSVKTEKNNIGTKGDKSETRKIYTEARGVTVAAGNSNLSMSRPNTQLTIPILILSYIFALTLPVAGWFAAAYQFLNMRVVHGSILLVCSTLITLVWISEYEQSDSIGVYSVFSRTVALPACESSEARSEMIKTFNTSQYSRLWEVDAIAARNLNTREGSTPEHRLCQAILILSNNESFPVHYQFFTDEEDPSLVFTVVEPAE